MRKSPGLLAVLGILLAFVLWWVVRPPRPSDHPPRGPTEEAGASPLVESSGSMDPALPDRGREGPVAAVQGEPRGSECRLFGSLVDEPGGGADYPPWAPRFHVMARGSEGREAKGTVDAEGQYEIRGLRAGEWLVSAGGIEHHSRRVSVVLSPGEERRLDLSLERQRMIDVAVVDERNEAVLASSDSLKGYTIATEDGEVVSRQDYSLLDSLSFTGTDFPVEAGSWRAAVLERGDFEEAYVIPPMFLGKTEPGVLVRLALSDAPWRFVTLWIEGVSVDCRPCEGADTLRFVLGSDACSRLTGTLRFTLPPLETGESTAHPPLQVTWGDGIQELPAGTGHAFRVTGLLPGEREVAVGGEGIASRVTRIQLLPGSEVDLGDLRWSRGCRLVGHVQAPTGEAIAGATVACWWRNEASGELEEVGQFGHDCDEHGDFAIDVGKGQHYLRVAKGRGPGDQPFGSQSVGVWVEGGETLVELTAVPLEQVACERLDADAPPITIQFHDPNGVHLARKTWPAGNLLVGLPPGKTECRLVGTDGVEIQRSVVFVRPGLRIQR